MNWILRVSILTVVLCTYLDSYAQFDFPPKEQVLFQYDAAGNRVVKQYAIQIRIGKQDPNTNNSQIQVGPNPAQSTVQISVEGEQPSPPVTGVLQLYSLNGQVVIEQDLNFGSNQIDVSHLASGEYILLTTFAQISKRTTLIVL